ncbi:MAG: hypothetical protein JW986_08740 [Methanotrichaceae archaeon]|nr:hypothetical protein [Methanotrichaceae archaeon]
MDATPGQPIDLAPPGRASPTQEIACSNLIATITGIPSSNGFSYRYNLTNNGAEPLRRITILDGRGRTLAILSKLEAGESQSLFQRDPTDDAFPDRLTVKAIDPQDRSVEGVVHNKLPRSAFIKPGYSAGYSSDPLLQVQSSTSDVEGEGSPSDNADADAEGDADIDYPITRFAPAELNITIDANRSRGYAGEVSLFRCTLKNSGDEIFYDVELECDGKNVSTGFLSPGQEIHIDGALTIEETTDILAQARGADPQGKGWTNSITYRIWKLSSALSLAVKAAPLRAHKGENVSIEVAAENLGSEELSNVMIWDDLGMIGCIQSLAPGARETLARKAPLDETLSDQVQALATDPAGCEAYASAKVDLHVLRSEIDLAVEPSHTVVYPGEPVEITWEIENIGEETLNNISFVGEGIGRCRLKDLAPGSSAKMAAIFTVNESKTIPLKAEGYGSNEIVSCQSEIRIRTISPQISLKATPHIITATAGDMVNISCLVANGGDDPLVEVALSEATFGAIASIGRLEPGEFQVASPAILAEENCTLLLEVSGRDSRGEIWTDDSSIEIRLDQVALGLDVTATPSQLRFGEKATISCTLENQGSIPLFNIFVISKTFGPLGTVDLLSPKESRTINVEKPITMDIEDVVTADAFTGGKVAVQARADLAIGLHQPIDRMQSPTTRIPAALRTGGRPVEVEGDDTTEPQGNESIAMQRSTGSVEVPLAESLGVYNQPFSDDSTLYQGRPSIQNLSIGRGIEASGPFDGISQLICYIQEIFDEGPIVGEETSPAPPKIQPAPEELLLTIESAPEPSSAQILDVMATPPEPLAGSPAKISVHIRDDIGVKSAALRWGVADAESKKISSERTIPMILEAGTAKDGYWSCLVPGQLANVYVSITVSASGSDGTSAHDGPFTVHWIAREETKAQGRTKIVSIEGAEPLGELNRSGGEGMLFIESSSVKGYGEISFKDTFQDTTLRFHEDLKGIGNIDLESERAIAKGNPFVNFNESRDLVFQGVLKGFKSLESPGFHGGMGASVTERFNISELVKSERGLLRTVNSTKNTVAFESEQAFNGSWNTRTQYARFNKKMKEDQQLRGFFETQKSITFQD